jgi:Flp pilus assembly protein TadB
MRTLLGQNEKENLNQMMNWIEKKREEKRREEKRREEKKRKEKKRKEKKRKEKKRKRRNGGKRDGASFLYPFLLVIVSYVTCDYSHGKCCLLWSSEFWFITCSRIWNLVRSGRSENFLVARS